MAAEAQLAPTSILVGAPSQTVSHRGQDARAANLALVLRTIFHEPGLTRAEIARHTGLTRVTISELVALLTDDGLVHETGIAEQARPGKKAFGLAVRDDTTDIVALDLSGSRRVRGGVYTLSGERRVEIDRDVAGATGQAATDLVIDLVDELMGHRANRLLGIGVGTPGTVDPGGRVLISRSFGWQDVDLCGILAARFDTLVAVMNDANAAVLAEQAFAGGPANLLRVQVTLGVGAGLLIDGQVMIGLSAAAGEIGHLVVEHNGARCLCGKRGCLETWASSPALARRIAAAPEHRDEILAEGGRRLGMALVPVLAMLDIDDVVLGGDTHLVTGPFARAAEALINERLHSEFRDPVTLRPSTLGDDATLLGVVALIARMSLGLR
jgi:predicted NBD/HSP70 family sugar kinase